MSDLFLIGKTAAVISPCRRYRYVLRRPGPGYRDRPVVFCMLNPSTADDVRDDPTIRRCLGFTRRWNGSELIVVNLFALRATDPRELFREGIDPVGVPDNETWIRRVLRECAECKGIFVCAWGIHGSYQRQDRAVIALAKEEGVKPHALALTKDAQPRHPLYLSANLDPQLWEPV